MIVGSICSGIGGLDLAVGGELAFVAETDPAASRVLAARFGVPNLGDWTDLHALPDVDLIVGGLPCQDVSVAGRRAGVDGERYLFDELWRVVGNMGTRPDLFLENVPGLLTANGGDAMARIVHGMARLGYVGRWGIVRASDAGCAHRRERWFCVARHPECVGRLTRAGFGASESTGEWRHGPRYDGGATAADADGQRQQGRTQRDVGSQARLEAPHGDDADGLGMEAWGDYGPAIARWEHVIGRPAPAPLDGKRLSPRFVEWLMGFDDGWVTGLDVPRTGALRMLGNAVVPQQAKLALEVVCGSPALSR